MGSWAGFSQRIYTRREFFKMQTSINGAQLIRPEYLGAGDPISSVDTQDRGASTGTRQATLDAAYRRLFKENRNLEYYRNEKRDSRFLNGQLNTREMICEMLCGDMYATFILPTNSNFRFVSLCFERVLGRSATQGEVFKWSSLLASEGLNAFAEKLTSSDEYIAAFGDDTVPYRRSVGLFSSEQNMPALPKELSIKRYTGPGNENQYYPSGPSTWDNGQPPAIARKAGAVLAVAGAMELVRIVATVAFEAFGTGGM